MRTLLLASAAVLALGGTGLAQTTFSGTAPGNPRSTAASNITASDTHSKLAPALPSVGYDLTYDQFLQAAQQAVRAGRTGKAQQALEQAETRLLTRAVPMGQGNTPDNGARVGAIRNARLALSKGDRAAVLQNIQMAMEHGGNGSMGGAGMSPGSVNNGGMSNGQTNGMAMPAAPQNGTAQQRTAMPNGMNNTPVGQQGGGGNESSGPAQ